MIRSKLLFIFIFVFCFNIFSLSFCMEQKQSLSGEKRGREKMEDSSVLVQGEGEIKRRKTDAINDNASDVEILDKKLNNLIGYYSWEKLFEKDLAEITRVVSNLKSLDFNNSSFDDNGFYDAFKSFNLNEREKCLNVIKLFLDKNIDWLRIFNIVLYDKNIPAILLLKEKVLDRIDEFSRTDVFDNDAIPFLPGSRDGESYGFFRNMSPLFIAICLQDLDLVVFLIEYCGADVNAAQIGSENSAGISPFKLATILKNKNIVNYLYFNGAKLSVEVLEYFLSHGVNINISGQSGWTFLHAACDIKDIDLVKYLISNGANLNALNDTGITPVGIALDGNFQEFFDYGFDSKIFDIKNEGEHFLFVSILLNFVDMVEYFISKGVAINTKNNYGMRALDILVKDFCFLQAASFVKKYCNNDMNIILESDFIKNNQDELIKRFCVVLSYLQNKDKNTDYYRIVNKINKFVIENFDKFSHEKIDYNNLNENLVFACEALKEISDSCNKYSINIKNDKDIFSKVFGILELAEFCDINNSETKKLLLDYLKCATDFLLKVGCKIDQVGSYGIFPIHHSCCGIDEVEKDEQTGAAFYEGLTKYLIENGAKDVNVKDASGCTPLNYAVIDGKKSSIITLLEHGAGIENLDGNGVNFYDLLKKSEKSKDKLLDIYFEKIRDSKEKFEKIKNNALAKKQSLLSKKFQENSCQICSKDFDYLELCGNLRRVFFVGCGHNFCEHCIKKIFVDSDEKLKCVLCGKEQSDIEFEFKEQVN